jgi:AraC-like DNA-binding protein
MNLAVTLLDVLGLLLIGTLITTSKNEKANRLLALALCCAILEQHLTVWISDSVATRTPLTHILFRLPVTVRLLALPLFYFYVRTLTQGTKVTLRDGLHFIPFAISAVYYVLVRLYGPKSLLEESPLFLWERYFRLILMFMIEVSYGYFAVTCIKRYRERAPGFVSDYSEVRMNWLLVVCAMLVLIWCVDLVDILSGPETVLAFYIPYATTLSLFVMAFFSLRNSLVFIETARPNTDGEATTLTPAQLKKYSQEMTQLFLQNQLHLKPELRLSDLATALNLKSYRVSEVINRGLHTNFYDLVNGYRVTKAKHMLGDSQFDHWNLLGIAEECGFRSKSVFNSVFKTKTGLTPSDFRKSSRQDSPDEQLN